MYHVIFILFDKILFKPNIICRLSSMLCTSILMFILDKAFNLKDKIKITPNISLKCTDIKKENTSFCPSSIPWHILSISRGGNGARDAFKAYGFIKILPNDGYDYIQNTGFSIQGMENCSQPCHSS